MRFQRLIQLACLSVLASTPAMATDHETAVVHDKALRALREQHSGVSSVDPERRFRLRHQQEAIEPRLFDVHYAHQSSAAPMQMAQQTSRTVQEEQRRALEALRSQQQSQPAASAPAAQAPAQQPTPRAQTAPAAQVTPPRSTPPPVTSAEPSATVREEQERALRALRSQPSDSRAIETRADRLGAPQAPATSAPAAASAPAISTPAPRSSTPAPATTITAQPTMRAAEPTFDNSRGPTLEERAQQRKALEALRAAQNPPQQAAPERAVQPRTSPPTLAPQIRATPSGRQATATINPAPAPANTDPNRPKTRRDKLVDLLEEYKADKMSPEEYQQRRAQILSQPE